MTINFKKSITLFISALFLLTLLNPYHAQATETYAGANNNKYPILIGSGQLDNGTHYLIYEIIDLDTIINPTIIASKTKTISIAYEGYITPPSTFYYSQKEADYGIIMSGTLYLTKFEHDSWPYFPKSTKATYKGTIVGNL